MKKEQKDFIEYKRANKVYLNELVDKKIKQRKILSCLNELYREMPEYEYLCAINEDVETEKIVISIQKAKQDLLAITASLSGVALASLMNLHINLNSVITTASLTVAGAITFRTINKEKIDEPSIDKTAKKNLKRKIKKEGKDLEKIAANYIEAICEYIPYYDKKKNDFIVELCYIFEENKEYIEQKIEEGSFNKDFNLKEIIDFHDQMFMDRKDFNSVIDNLIEIEKNKEKTRIR